MTRLSVNINKIATLRNSRGGNNPNLIQVALDCERFGADGITVHPRPDERHIRYADVYDLKKVLTTEFNIEGNPKEDKFVQLVLDTLPEQVTLVPDALNQLTSNHGWDIKSELTYLQQTVAVFKNAGIRVSLFIDPVPEIATLAAQTGADRVELYTEAYAKQYSVNNQEAVSPYTLTAAAAAAAGLGLNAGHDLDRTNLAFFAKSITDLQEVSIGHALISDSLYFGLQNTIQLYKRCLQ